MGPQWAPTAGIILAWYTSNIGVLLLNKALLTSIGFRQPVFLTLCHMLACCALGGSLAAAEVMPLKRLKSSRQFHKICVLSTLFCLTIVLGNVSLKYLPVSFNQALGATTPLFTAVFALTLQGIKEARQTYLALVPVVGGIVMATLNEPSFHLLGFLACTSATAGRALKSVVQAMLLADTSEKLDPMSLLLYMSGLSVVLLLPAAIFLEPSSFGQAADMMLNKPGFAWWLICNCTLAYAVNLTNFLVTKYTSALTLQVLGNMKGVVASGVSVALFKNPVTSKGIMGYLITVAGVMLYSESKRRARVPMRVSAKMSDSAEGLPLLATNIGNSSAAAAMQGNVMRQRPDS